MRRTLFLLAMLVTAAPLAAGLQCESSYPSRVAYDDYWGEFCGYTGSGCTDCWYIGPDGWGECVTNGVRCEPRIHPLGP